MRISDWSSDVCSSDLTGGSALGETSMRSNPALSALRRASAVDTTPTCSPFSSTRRTWAEVIISFTRGPSRDGVLSKGGRAIVWLLVAVENQIGRAHV